MSRQRAQRNWTRLPSMAATAIGQKPHLAQDVRTWLVKTYRASCRLGLPSTSTANSASFQSRSRSVCISTDLFALISREISCFGLPRHSGIASSIHVVPTILFNDLGAFCWAWAA